MDSIGHEKILSKVSETEIAACERQMQVTPLETIEPQSLR
jgi:hypothetical protein